jgi:hypothetical protein
MQGYKIPRNKFFTSVIKTERQGKQKKINWTSLLHNSTLNVETIYQFEV